MRWGLLALLLLACRARVVNDIDWTRPPPQQSAAEETPKTIEAATAVETNPEGDCANEFGNALPVGYGRLDGTLAAIVTPANRRCALPDPDHLVLQVKALGKIYRVLINLRGDRGSGEPLMQAVEGAALEGPAFGDGWRPATSINYARTFGMSSADLTYVDIVRDVTAWLEVGKPLSIFGHSAGGSSVHLVHRTSSGRDGALVIDPRGESPVYLIFAFAGQEF